MSFLESADLAGSVAGDLSIWGLFLQADIVVQFVMILLIAASFWCWAVIFEKVLRMRRLDRQAGEFEDRFWSGGSLDDLYERVGQRPEDPMSAIFVAAMREWRRSTERGAVGEDSRLTLTGRIDRVMEIALAREKTRVELPEGPPAPFELDRFARYCLMNGVDQLGYLLRQSDRISAWEQRAGG